MEPGGTIVVVEDEPAIADLLDLYLRREGFRVLLADNSDRGAELVAREAPRLVILDVGLPGTTDGLGLCRQIREAGSTPILMLTARDSEVDRVVGLELGADDYVTKPFSPREVVARVKAILRRADSSPEAAPSRLRSGAVEVDMARREVAVNDEPVILATQRVRSPGLLRGPSGPRAQPATAARWRMGRGLVRRRAHRRRARTPAPSQARRCLRTRNSVGRRIPVRLMTLHRRVTVWLLVVVAAALGVAGLGSQLLVRAATLDEARRDVASEAHQVAAATEDLRRPATFAVLRQTLRLKGAAVVRFTPAGVPLSALPAGVRRADLRPASLAAGSTVSGIRGTLVYAASPVPVGNTRTITAVVFTRELNGLSRGARFFALSALGTLLLAAIVGSRLGRRIARPIELAEDITRRMAAGDLTARIELPARADAEVTSLAASIGSLASSLERSRAIERDFLLSVSHDLRTPLTAIRGYGEALSDGAITDNARAGAVITSEARRLERLVGDLLDLARLRRGNILAGAHRRPPRRRRRRYRRCTSARGRYRGS